MIDVKDEKWFPKKISVLGAARSGLAVAKYCTKNGIDVFISDTCPADTLDMILAANGLAHVSHEAGEHTHRCLNTECIVISPGIRSDIEVLHSARKRKIPVWSELEFGFRVSEALFLVVTGSTGKSTTVSMLGEIVKYSGRPGVVAGNIGAPVTAMVPTLEENGIAVVEVSSFQLEAIDRFLPHSAAVLNVYANHLDRYRSIKAYWDAKKRIAQNMTVDQSLILNANDSRLMQWAEEMKLRTTVVVFGAPHEHFDSIWHEKTTIRYALGARGEGAIDVSGMRVIGTHNMENACVATALAKCAGIDDEAIARGVQQFPGLEHRLEFVREKDGVRYYNDSKSTTAESIRSAVEAFDHGVHLIAGGKDKGCDFSVVSDILRQHVADAVVIGETAERIIASWGKLIPIVKKRSLEDAVAASASGAADGDVVVFSPGCSSFDMFDNYEHRGRRFKEIVNRL
jgi:UDP-N-acetylmuramoylalanine--D-glutamate ligase